MFGTKKYILLKLTLLFLFGCAYALVYLYSPHTEFIGTHPFKVQRGDGSRAIGQKLKRGGVIRSKWAFVLYVSALGIASDLRPGTFAFGDSSTIPDIAERLVRGGTEEHTITIPEGWNIYDIANYLENNSLSSRSEFLAVANGEDSRAWALLEKEFTFLSDIPPGSRRLEGYLFPDTYRIFAHTPTIDIIRKMLSNFGQKIKPSLETDASRTVTLFEVVTMASLLEKEAKEENDQAIVSGILWKRISLGFGLQVDATINYARRMILGAAPKSRLSTEETKINSPYNTYKYRGLPKGPIANPGLSSLGAALLPKNSPYLYYLSTEDGTIIFSKTLEEHNTAKAKYLR